MGVDARMLEGFAIGKQIAILVAVAMIGEAGDIDAAIARLNERAAVADDEAESIEGFRLAAQALTEARDMFRKGVEDA